MARTIISDDFRAEKDAATVGIIWLYRINLSDTPDDSGEDDLFLAEYDTDIEYFKDVNTPQTYTRFPIRHGGISENTQGRVENLKVTISNVSQEIQFELENRDALRGRQVTIRQVFVGLLADSDAYLEDTYYIDKVATTANSAEFTLSTKMDIQQAKVPRRRYQRNYCPWRYKGYGCWHEAGLLTEHTVESVGFSAYVDASLRFAKKDCTGLVRDATCSLTIDMKVDDPDDFDLSNSRIEITSSGSISSEVWQYTNIGALTSIKGATISNSWQTFIITLDNFVETDPLDVSEIDFIRIFAYFAPDIVSSGLYWRRASLSWPNMPDYTAPGDDTFKGYKILLLDVAQEGSNESSFFPGLVGGTMSMGGVRPLMAITQPKDFSGVRKAVDSLLISIKVTETGGFHSDLIRDAVGYSDITISSAVEDINNSPRWVYDNIGGQVPLAGGGTDEINVGPWYALKLPFSDFVEHDGPLNLSSIRSIRLRISPLFWGTYSPMMYFQAVSIFYKVDFSMVDAKFQDRDATGLERDANDFCYIEMKCDNPTKISENSQLEITSSGGSDVNEWSLTDLSKKLPLEATYPDTANITASYQAFKIPFSSFNVAGGDLDVSAINYVRAYCYSTDASSINLSFRNVYVSVSSSCSKTLIACKQHNNQLRFGGFPGVPSRRVRGG